MYFPNIFSTEWSHLTQLETVDSTSYLIHNPLRLSYKLWLSIKLVKLHFQTKFLFLVFQFLFNSFPIFNNFRKIASVSHFRCLGLQNSVMLSNLNHPIFFLPNPYHILFTNFGVETKTIYSFILGENWKSSDKKIIAHFVDFSVHIQQILAKLKQKVERQFCKYLNYSVLTQF